MMQRRKLFSVLGLSLSAKQTLVKKPVWHVSDAGITRYTAFKFTNEYLYVSNKPGDTNIKNCVRVLQKNCYPKRKDAVEKLIRKHSALLESNGFTIQSYHKFLDDLITKNPQHFV